ncbi:MAG TPA: SufD family Fe-S cluster assembly protein [Tepiditoga sp.]|nr:SufD family Fe-S cluster assembly protein [Tepiditoga sp.]
MNTVYEKPTVNVHGDLLMVEHITERINSEKDYNKDIIDNIIKNSENSDLSKIRLFKFSEYEKLGFPVWKRAKLNGFDPKNYKKINIKTNLPLINTESAGIEAMEILGVYDFEGADRKFVLMSDAFFNSGFYINGKDYNNKEIVINYDLNENIIENTIIKMPENTNLRIIRIINGTKNDGFKNNVLRGVLEKNSSLTIINVNILGENDINIDNEFFDLKENSSLNIFDLHISGKISSPHIVVRFSEKNAKANIKPYFLGYGNTVTDMLYLMRFYGKDTFGSINGKGVLKDTAKSVFRGFLDLKKGAKEVTADESEYTLVLSEKARAEAIPSLLVDENEVNAAHAASVGTINEDKLYYLMTRGFSTEEAKKLISMAIFEPFIDEIEQLHPETAEVIRNVIISKI